MMRRSQGFTLLELIMVIVIIGILVSIATLGMADYISRTKLRTAIYAVEADIRRARWIARSTSSTCYIRFDTISNTYTVNGTDDAKIPDGIRFGADPGVTGKPDDPSGPPPADGISFDSSGHANTLIYYPAGDVVPAGTIYLTDGRGTMAIRVARTGRPKLWRSAGGKKWTVM